MQAQVLGEAGWPEIEISIEADGNQPWWLTFTFLNDVYSIIAAAWRANDLGGRDFEFVLTSVEPGSKRFKGSVRRRDRGTVNVYGDAVVVQRNEGDRVADDRPGLLAATALQLGVAVLASVIGTAIASPHAPLPTYEPPVVSPSRIEDVDRYVRLHGHRVRIIVRDAEGNETFEVLLSDETSPR